MHFTFETRRESVRVARDACAHASYCKPNTLPQDHHVHDSAMRPRTPPNVHPVQTAPQTDFVISDDSGIGLQDDVEMKRPSSGCCPEEHPRTFDRQPRVPDARPAEEDDAPYWSQISDDSIESWGAFDSARTDGNQ